MIKVGSFIFLDTFEFNFVSVSLILLFGKFYGRNW